MRRRMCEITQSLRVAIGKMLVPLSSRLRMEPVQIQLHRRNAPCFEIRFSRLPCCWPQPFVRRLRLRKAAPEVVTHHPLPRRRLFHQAAIEAVSQLAATIKAQASIMRAFDHFRMALTLKDRPVPMVVARHVALRLRLCHQPHRS
jgi:hypothetical protein